MGTIYQIKRNLKVIYKAEVRLHSIRRIRNFPNKTLAKLWITQTENDIHRETLLPKSLKVTLAEAIERYFREVIVHKKAGTQKLHKHQLEWFLERYGETKLSNIDSAWLSRVREELKVEKIDRNGELITRSPSTVNRYLNPLSNLLSKCKKEWGWIREIPTLAKYKEPRGRTRYLREEEASKLVRALEKERRDVRLVVLIALCTGGRLGEICSLKWENFDPNNRFLSFVETKNNSPRSVYISRELVEELHSVQPLSGESSYIFPATQRNKKKPYIYEVVRQRFAKLVEELGFEGVTFHTLRHTYASWQTQMGIDRKQLSDILGHNSSSMTDRYSHTDVKGTAPYMERISEKVFLKSKSQLLSEEKR